MLTGAVTVFEIDVALLECITQIKLFSNATFKIVVYSVATLGSVFAVEAALGSLSFVLAEGARELKTK